MSRRPSRQFRCWLDEQPGYLAPVRLLSLTNADELIVTSTCRFSPPQALPAPLQSSVKYLSLNASDHVLWVRDSATKLWWPFWVNNRYRSLLKGMHPGSAVQHALSSRVRRLLAMAGVLTDKRHSSERRERWRELLRDCGAAFQRNRYVSVPGLLHPFHIDALRKHYRRLVRTGGMYHGDGTNTDRYTAHNEPVSRFFHRQFLPVVTAIAGEPMKPSYTYVVSYQGGAELEPHVDREQCEFTLSVLLDYPPEHERDRPWPLCISTPLGDVRIEQQIGEAVLFRGRELLHFRPPLPARYTSTSMLLHYVRKSFRGPLD